MLRIVVKLQVATYLVVRETPSRVHDCQHFVLVNDLSAQLLINQQVLRLNPL